MNKYRGSIYKPPRVSAGLTQERAAERLNVTTRALASYETGERIPSDDVVIAMSDVYNCQYLVYQHVRANMEAAQRIIPEVNLTSLPVAILKLQKEITDFLTVRDEMIDITSDGVIDATEAPRWQAIMKELEDISTAILSLKLSKKEDDQNGKAFNHG